MKLDPSGNVILKLTVTVTAALTQMLGAAEDGHAELSPG